jgi:hypothetical protein
MYVLVEQMNDPGVCRNFLQTTQNLRRIAIHNKMYNKEDKSESVPSYFFRKRRVLTSMKTHHNSVTKMDKTSVRRDKYDHQHYPK